MSTDHRRITLTETEDGRWTAREDPAGLTAHGETKEAALAALDAAGGGEEIDPDAPLFSGEPFIDADLGDESIDDVLYGPVETDDNGDGAA